MPDAGLTLLDLRLRRRSVLGYTIGMAAYTLAIVALYPTFKSDTGLDRLTANDPTMAALFGITGSLTTPTGWLNANLYANFAPLIVLLTCIGYGASCLAGQDEDGTLCLIATLPVSRPRIVLRKAATLAAISLPVNLAILLCVVAGRGFQLPVATPGLLGVTAGLVLLGLDFGAVAMLVGAATGSRGTAIGVTSALAATAYLVSSLAPVVRWLRSARVASPLYHAVGNGQLEHGPALLSLAVLAAVAAVAIAATVAAFDRLDVH